MSLKLHEIPRPSDEPGSPLATYVAGSQTFARLIVRWMDGNAWSHPVMTKLAKAAMGGKEGWLHSSQIASLRAGDTRNPGPRTFVAIERLNYYLWRYHTEKKLIPGTSSSNDYVTATPITEDDVAPGLGWFVEVFCGYRAPKDFDISVMTIPPDQAELISKRLGRLIRQQMVAQSMDLVEDLGSALFNHYPTKERASLNRVRALVLNGAALDTDELETELPNLAALLTGLGHTTTEAELLETVRR
jgi:hypothetical protein